MSLCRNPYESDKWGGVVRLTPERGSRNGTGMKGTARLSRRTRIERMERFVRSDAMCGWTLVGMVFVIV